VKMALKRELQMMSAENRLKRVHVGADDDDDDDDELPLLYPFDADQVAFFACLLSLCFLYQYCVSKKGKSFLSHMSPPGGTYLGSPFL